MEVSRLGLGAIPFGTTLDVETSSNVVDAFQEAGGNLIDTSNLYGGGMVGTNTEMAGTSERTIGKILKGRRDEFIVASKGCWLMEDEVTPNSTGLGRTYLARNIENSLKQLNTDYIDLYQCHSWDFYTPVEETMRVLDDFVRAGKIRYLGVSNWDGWHVVKANSYAKNNNLTRLTSNQVWYSLADRTIEHSVLPACRDQEVSIVAWGALAQGFLTGRYRRGSKRPEESRFDNMKKGESSSWERLAIERNWATIDVLDRIATNHGRTIPVISARWLMQSETCDVILLGGSSSEQYVSILDVLNFELSDEEMKELTGVSEPEHPYPRNFIELFGKKESEFYGGLR